MQLTRDIILFKEKIQQLTNLYISNSKRKSQLDLDFDYLEKHCLMCFSIYELPIKFMDHFFSYVLLPNGIVDEIEKYTGFFLYFEKRLNLKDERQFIMFMFFNHSNFDWFFIPGKPFTWDSYIPTFNKPTVLPVLNINKNQYLLKDLFLNMQKIFKDKDIFKYIDSIMLHMP